MLFNDMLNSPIPLKILYKKTRKHEIHLDYVTKKYDCSKKDETASFSTIEYLVVAFSRKRLIRDRRNKKGNNAG